jgi:hypothetical protein
MPLKQMTIDEAIKKLEFLKSRSRFGGDTVVVFCGVGSGIEYLPINAITLEQDNDGAICRIDVEGLRLVDS